MADPLVVNILPESGVEAGVGESTRCSIRATTNEIARDTLNVYVGRGPVFYEADALPEDTEGQTIFLQALSGDPPASATRTMESDALKIEKTSGVSQKGLYFLGGLHSPAAPTDDVMVEFTVTLTAADMTPDMNDFTGVLLGLLINDTGVTVRFYTDGGGTQWIEVHSAEQASVASLASAMYDWDGQEDTYKLLWSYSEDSVRLYRAVSGDTTDELLADITISTIPAPPSDELYAVQPWVFFGHGYPTPGSISYWKRVLFLHKVATPVVTGQLRNTSGFIRTDNVIEYPVEKLPSQSPYGWKRIPDTYGTLEDGVLFLNKETLEFTRKDPSASVGFYRREEIVGEVLVDFVARVAVDETKLDHNATGVEFYIDDGTTSFIFSFLQEHATGTQYLGFCKADKASAVGDLIEYNSIQQGFSADVQYRLILSGDEIALYHFLQEGDDWTEEKVLTTSRLALPASEMPGPGIGFLHDAFRSEVLSTLVLSYLRYTVGTETLHKLDLLAPPAPWSLLGTGTITDEDDYVRATAEDGNAYRWALSLTGTLQPDNGWVVEWSNRIVEYVVDGEVNPTRADSGAFVRVLDGTYVYNLRFIDAGPELGKVVAFRIDGDAEATVLSLRAGDAEMDGRYAQVEWMNFHVYRLERTPGGYLRLFVDGNLTPVIEVETAYFDAEENASSPQVAFGKGSSNSVTADWVFFRHGVSRGLDVSAEVPEEDSLSYFDHRVNVLVEVEDV